MSRYLLTNGKQFPVEKNLLVYKEFEKFKEAFFVKGISFFDNSIELFDNEEVPNSIIQSEWFTSFFNDIKPILKESNVNIATPVWEK